LHEDLCILIIMSLLTPLRKRNASDRVLEKIKTHIMVSNIFSENCAIYDVMWKNVLQLKRPDDNITAHSKYVMLFAFTHQQWLHTHVPLVCLDIHYLSC
jgi:hypothetical protein